MDVFDMERDYDFCTKNPSTESPAPDFEHEPVWIKCRLSNNQTDGRTRTDGRTKGQTHIHSERQIDRQTDRQTQKQTDKETDIKIQLSVCFISHQHHNNKLRPQHVLATTTFSKQRVQRLLFRRGYDIFCSRA
ncbi:hypothetical protein DPMN_163783 [Dreissena polymorpha]|uniref:Uncharacterized protein n=1 Tax=Dreissena polymorpha TaxID=45954 RepID=A0A9D4IUR3_DREPO|nr:hypothetical protein DPMN_163783 [Dreissena polymorpha]